MTSSSALPVAHAALGLGAVAVAVYLRLRKQVGPDQVTLRVGGVPEHFNLPFHDAIPGLAKAGVRVEWFDQPGGTGEMTKGLREGTLDVAIALTEGLVADLAKGNPSRLVAQYVQSPLRWGVHVAAGSSLQTIDDLRGKRFGISRPGSGSHLMAYVLAQQRGWDVRAMAFEVVGKLDNARAAFKGGTIDAFMWEEFTTKPLVYSGEWRCVGVCTTPWPCFAVAVRSSALAAHPAEVRVLLERVRACARAFKAAGDASVRRVTDKYGIKPDDARAWFDATEWSCELGMSDEMLRHVVEVLRGVRVLDAEVDTRTLVHDLRV